MAIPPSPGRLPDDLYAGAGKKTSCDAALYSEPVIRFVVQLPHNGSTIKRSGVCVKEENVQFYGSEPPIALSAKTGMLEVRRLGTLLASSD
jgi:hypothetical protein